MSEPLYSEIITIGDELLLGRTVNSNAAFLGQRLAECGIPARWSSCVADDLAEIQAAISLAMNRADVVILSGGLGPTPDDLTRDAIAQFYRFADWSSRLNNANTSQSCLRSSDASCPCNP